MLIQGVAAHSNTVMDILSNMPLSQEEMQSVVDSVFALVRVNLHTGEKQHYYQ